MTCFYDFNDDLLILNIHYQAIIAQALFPVSGERPRVWREVLPWVFRLLKHMKKLCDFFLQRFIEFLNFALCAGFDSNCPGQALSLTVPTK